MVLSMIGFTVPRLLYNSNSSLNYTYHLYMIGISVMHLVSTISSFTPMSVANMAENIGKCSHSEKSGKFLM